MLSSLTTYIKMYSWVLNHNHMKKKHVTVSHVTNFLQAFDIAWWWLLRKVKTCCNTISSKVLKTFLWFTLTILPCFSYVLQQDVLRYSPQSSTKVRNQWSWISKPLSAVTLWTQTIVPFFSSHHTQKLQIKQMHS